jgi:hypothetical protein
MRKLFTMKTTLPLYLIGAGIVVLILQNAGIIRPLHPPTTVVAGPVTVQGYVGVASAAPLDVNISHLVGRPLVESAHGMYIGVSGLSNNIIPIHWGEMTVDGTVDVNGPLRVEGTVDVGTIDDILGTVDVDVGNEVRLFEPVQVSIDR